MKKFLAFLLSVGLILSLALPAGAVGRTETTTIYYRGITVVVNGETIVPADESGKAVEPFIIDGTTYLPLRAVASALGLDVGWDNEPSTIRLTSGGEAVCQEAQPAASSGSKTATLTYRGITILLDGKLLTPTDASGKVVEPFIIDGTTYLPLRAIASALGLGVDWDNETSTVSLGYWEARVARETIITAADAAFTDVKSTRETVYTYGKDCTVEEIYLNGALQTTVTSYYNGGLLTQTVTADSESNILAVETYTYDENGVLQQLLHDGTDELYLMVYSYNDDGSLHHSFKYHDSATPKVHGTRSNYTYDENGRLTRLFIMAPWGTTTDIKYVYNEAGQLIRDDTVVNDVIGSDTGASWTEYSYDALGRLTATDSKLGHYEYQYDADGRLLGYTCAYTDGTYSKQSIEYTTVQKGE